MALSPPQHVIIVGAGALGMLTALELHRRGLRVSLVEKGRAGRESSWAGGGILSPILPWNYPEPIWRLSRRSLDLYQALGIELAGRTGVDPELSASGAISLDPQPRAQAFAWCERERLEARPWRGPLYIGGPEQSGVALPWIGHVRNPRLCRALRSHLLQLGVELLEHCAVTGWYMKAGRVVGVRTADGERRADAVVLAAGAWSAQLEASLPVAPVRGQMLLLACEPGRLASIVFRDGRYLIPRRDGRILVGSTVEHGGFDTAVSAQAREELLGFAVEVLGREVAGKVEHHWAGLRPGTRDELPYIGEHPDLPGLFLNTGHYRNGLIMGPASAELLADLMLGRPTRIDAAPYRAERARRRA
ncbi:glycine oxidase ThiO [Hydrocarboniphaga effusa]|uniref:FAD dependent oxidoreductase domain-containing protein n=1 Tax=Hydrocarboniphaga effusa AP103 TaxID=1172194 RepID=I7ZDE2_9GAMM|nr:glycine oxidase ThiO [Hydrocarboniphaga effusa]EIT69717.1 hypothetical protein WQQ_32990 [Hydrocarboniphaga effusa AP103]